LIVVGGSEPKIRRRECFVIIAPKDNAFFGGIIN